MIIPKPLTDYEADLLIECEGLEIGSWIITNGDILLGVYDKYTDKYVLTTLGREEMCRLRDYLDMVIKGDE